MRKKEMKCGVSKAEVTVGVCRAAGASYMVIRGAFLGFGQPQNTRLKIHMFFCFPE